MILQIIYVATFAFAMSLAFSGFMVEAGIGDVPDERSNHARTTPTGGGVGVVAALAGLFLILPRFFEMTWALPEWPIVLTLLWAVALLGLMDDMLAIPTRVKFALFVGLAAMAVWVIGPVRTMPYADTIYVLPYAFGFAGSLLWIFVVTNVVNFMDGSNGLMAIVMSFACIGLAVTGALLGAFHTTLIPIALAAGLLGFLPYNLRKRAMIFSGDTGSLTVGFGFAISVLWLCREVTLSAPVFIGPVLILPFLADALLTLLRRAKHRENLLQPHKSHIYQRLIAAGHSHVRVAIYYGGATLLAGVFAYVSTQSGFYRYISFLLFPVIICTGIYYALVYKLKRPDQSN